MVAMRRVQSSKLHLVMPRDSSHTKVGVRVSQLQRFLTLRCAVVGFMS